MSFRNILGQEAALSVLKSSNERRRVASAYLFHGPDAVGKRTAAMAFAASILCPEGIESGDACGKCPPCKLRVAGNHPGLVHLTRLSPPPPKSGGQRTMIGIDQVHEFGRLVSLKPSTGECTVGIIDEAERSSLDALNALLKTLEEPRPGATIILVSGNRELLPDTIRSRCQGVRFRPLPEEVLSEILVRDCGVSGEDGRRLAALSGGSVSRALRVLEMGLLEGEELVGQLLDGQERDPVEVAQGFVALVSGGKPQEVRMKTRELLLLLLERARRRFLTGERLHREPESARICFESIRRAVGNVGRNVDPAGLLKALIIEILPPWTRKRTTNQG